ncbi:hypothetical protein P1X15_24380 [Runella sp. MFBS21]|uniref:hypothetical protein n=1 Tax=Runella sp. MFBS21 TaxID=3034018 RepID=UPI0023F82DE0|nr:hypothetical protein [Runella sp. MFBS21]MDF7820782.1 hypothetical protein [Runella sp. MFBS21]
MKEFLMILGLCAGCIVLVSALWSGIVFLMSYLSGWQRLALKYKTPLQTKGLYTGISGRIGMVSYNGILRVAFSENGLYLHVMSLFGMGHPPLLFPWSELKNLHETDFLMSHSAKCTIDGITIALPARYFATLQSYLSAYT